jgi:hypothetical protein
MVRRTRELPSAPRFAAALWPLTLRLRSGQALGSLADALHDLTLSFTKPLHRETGFVGSFWQKRYYDRNVRDERELVEKLPYLHRNPVQRELVKAAADWKWSSFRHYALREVGMVEIESQWTAAPGNENKWRT